MKFGRKAYGPQRIRTAVQRAQHVAEAIVRYGEAGRVWTWQTFGLDGNPEQQRRVLLALGRRDGGV